LLGRRRRAGDPAVAPADAPQHARGEHRLLGRGLVRELPPSGRPDGRRLAERLDRRAGEAVVPALEGRLAAPEEEPRGLEHLVGAPAALAPAGADRLELGLVPAGPDPEDVAPAREM